MTISLWTYRFKKFVLEPIYGDLSRPELLNRCKGSNTQNNNESYNGLLWHFAPKHLHSGLKTIELANFFAVAIFNEGFQAILKAFETMGVIIRPSAKDYAEKRDMKVAEKRHREASKGSSDSSQDSCSGPATIFRTRGRRIIWAWNS
ncbi:hypothetical protein EAI_06978 [Harpegnathos saltator]|uniref:Uncharacterized protein n=1 Tax=Harpegnathos saltator TaxID=610380 RepID=E2C9G5_HARSA|nr:hypothetical protein EAI_06978 [Harpegnathos saltator]